MNEAEKLKELLSLYKKPICKNPPKPPKKKPPKKDPPKFRQDPPPVQFEEVDSEVFIEKVEPNNGKGQKVGYWTPAEHRKYLEIVAKYKDQLLLGGTPRDMVKELEQSLPSRTRKQILHHHYDKNPFQGAAKLKKEESTKKVQVTESQPTEVWFEQSLGHHDCFTSEKPTTPPQPMSEGEEWERWKRWKQAEEDERLQKSQEIDDKNENNVEILYLQAQVPEDFNVGQFFNLDAIEFEQVNDIDNYFQSQQEDSFL